MVDCVGKLGPPLEIQLSMISVMQSRGKPESVSKQDQIKIGELCGVLNPLMPD